MKPRKGTAFFLLSAGLTVVFCLSTQTFLAGSASASEPVKLNFVSFVPLSNAIEFKQIKKRFIDKINAQAQGELAINVRGGPESIPPFNLGVSVQRGVIDMATIPTAYFEALVPWGHSSSRFYTNA